MHHTPHFGRLQSFVDYLIDELVAELRADTNENGAESGQELRRRKDQPGELYQSSSIT